MNVVAVRVEQEVADVFPGPLVSCPRSEELNGKTVRLRPASAGLQRFVESPSQISPPFVVQHRASRICIAGTVDPIQRVVPTPFPDIESYAAHSINVGGPPNFVMTKDAGLKENAHPRPAPRVDITSEPIKDLFQLASEFARNQRVAGRRVDPKILSRTNRYHPQIAPITEIKN